MRHEWSYAFDEPRERIWPYVGDTNTVNRLAGFPPMTYSFERAPDGATRVNASTRVGPVTLRWTEMPFAWTVPEYHDVVREFHSGPMLRSRARTELVSRPDGGTTVRVIAELEPRSAIFAPVVAAIAKRARRGMDRAIMRIREELAADSAPASPNVPARFAPLVAQGYDRDVVASLAAFVLDADDAEVARMRPFELADRLGIERRAMLRTLLAATRQGLLNLSWSVLCPSCGGPTGTMSALAELGASHCPACDVRYDPQFDRSVEVTFDARPLGRRAVVPIYCLAGPGTSPHVAAQCAIAPGDLVAFDARLAPGQYVARVLGGASLPFSAAATTAPEAIAVRLDHRGISGIPSEVAASTQRLDVSSGLDAAAVLRIERADWPDTITTAAQVTALQEFRDLFASDVLAPGVEVGIRTLAILFTDVIGSTAMYRAHGDAPAYRAVSDHFDAIRDVVAPLGGAIVKTIGDAVMAVFEDAGDCFDAAMRLDAAVRHLHIGDRPLRLRVGLHVGPCIAMRANGALDYFGSTVNLAARLEGTAGAAEVAMSQADADRPEIARRLAPLAPMRSELRLKGIESPVTVITVRCASQ